MVIRKSTLIVGVDGCKAGWIAVTFMPDAPSQAEVKVFKSFADLVSGLQPVSIIAVDMPIGLPDRTIKGGREPDWDAKKFLGPRRASVFLVPSRGAVYAHEQGYAHVCAVARETSDPPRSPSIQAYWIFPRIQQIDRILRQDLALRKRVFEVHPEVSFSLMNNGEPIPERKKVKGHVYLPGMQRRTALLARQGFSATFLDANPPKGAAPDDFYDACACAWSGNRILRRDARVFPARPGVDAEGLQAAIRA
ncbi:MAG: DUF429 domain-containing protein [Methylocella sp.]